MFLVSPCHLNLAPIDGNVPGSEEHLQAPGEATHEQRPLVQDDSDDTPARIAHQKATHMEDVTYHAFNSIPPYLRFLRAQPAARPDNHVMRQASKQHQHL